MDVSVPSIPSTYDGYPQRLRAYIAAHKPDLRWQPRAGMRVPETAEDIAALRVWVGRLHEAGFRLARFTEEETDPFEQRILESELAATGVPYVLGNPLVAGALKAFGTPEQKRQYLASMSSGRHIWTQLFSEPNAGSDLTSLQTRGRLDGDAYVIDGQKV